MNKSFFMAYRRRKRSKRMYFRKRKGFRRINKRRYRRKKLSTKRYKQWWPDKLYTKLKYRYTGLYNIVSGSVLMDRLRMSNPLSSFGPFDSFANNSQTDGQLYHLFLLNPNMYSTQASSVGFHSVLKPSPTTAVSVPIVAEFADMRTVALRYIAYRVMGVKITCTFRPSDLDQTGNPGAWPYFVTGMPFQDEDATLGNYWDGKSITTQNAVASTLTYNDVGNLPHGFIRRVKGQGAKNGGTKTISMMMYPWKVYGLTREQWLNDDKARMIINTPNSTKYHPYLCMSAADFNPEYQRGYSMDYTVTVFVSWEGQKFLQPDQA